MPVLLDFTFQADPRLADLAASVERVQKRILPSLLSVVRKAIQDEMKPWSKSGEAIDSIKTKRTGPVTGQIYTTLPRVVAIDRGSMIYPKRAQKLAIPLAGVTIVPRQILNAAFGPTWIGRRRGQRLTVLFARANSVKSVHHPFLKEGIRKGSLLAYARYEAELKKEINK